MKRLGLIPCDKHNTWFGNTKPNDSNSSTPPADASLCVEFHGFFGTLSQTPDDDGNLNLYVQEEAVRTLTIPAKVANSSLYCPDTDGQLPDPLWNMVADRIEGLLQNGLLCFESKGRQFYCLPEQDRGYLVPHYNIIGGDEIACYVTMYWKRTDTLPVIPQGE